MDALIPKKVKLVVVGDTACGKTSLIIFLIRKICPLTHQPTICRKYDEFYELDSKYLKLSLFDTSGEQPFSLLRPKSEPDVFIMCFSIDEPNSLLNIEKKWIHEVREYFPNTPFILVGNKRDARENFSLPRELMTRRNFVNTKDAAVMAIKLNACGYLECSAKDGRGVQRMFEFSIRLALNRRKQKKIKCSWF